MCTGLILQIYETSTDIALSHMKNKLTPSKALFVLRSNDVLNTNILDLDSQMQLIYTTQLAKHQPLPSGHAILFADSSYQGEYCLIPMILIDTTMQTQNPPA